MLILLMIALFGLGLLFGGAMTWSSAREVLGWEGYRVDHHPEAPITWGDATEHKEARWHSNGRLRALACMPAVSLP